MQEKACIYLRKSRADEELEQTGKFNTLSRHKDTLLKVAENNNFYVVKIYEEIVSGESISGRPEMKKLLVDVENNLYNAVIVMDMDRLGRGNMQDQGLILDTFKQSNTKIVTPRKIYDLKDEFDEEYSEFEAFMARKELKIISRRMQRGRLKSIEEGNNISTYAAYGYKFEGQGRNRHLVIDEEKAPAVRMIFDMYIKGFGGTNIAKELHKLGYKSATGIDFSNSSVLSVIKNPVYAGKNTWKKKEYNRKDGKKKVKLRDREDWIIVEGSHEKIVSEETYNLAYQQLQQRTHPSYGNHVRNPLANLVICEHCGKAMHYRPYQKGAHYIICPNTLCTTSKASRFDYVEEAVLTELNKISLELKSNVRYQPDKNKTDEAAIKNVRSELEKLKTQQNNLHDLLEQGVYSIDKFLERGEIIAGKINSLNKSLKELTAKKEILSSNDKAIMIKNAVDAYMASDEIIVKNQALKKVINKILYSKSKDCGPKEFKLTVILKI